MSVMAHFSFSSPFCQNGEVARRSAKHEVRDGGRGPARVTLRDAFRKKYALARQFRKALTDGEVRIWAGLKGKPDGLHFRKQHPIGPYIVDFYCAKAKLVIEIDGEVHGREDNPQRDERRILYLEGLGLEVLRIPGDEAMGDSDEVVLGILTLARTKARK
jgi:very-short-patch-repair endonuclease